MMNTPVIQSSSHPNILVIKLSALGDFIMCFAAFAAIRHHHADAKITLLTTAGLAELARRSGWFDEVQIDTKPSAMDIIGWLKLRQKLRCGDYARVYDLQTSERSAFYYQLFFPGPYPKWVGKHPQSTFRTHGAAWEKLHAFDMRREQLKLAGIAETPLPDLAWLDADISRYHLPEKFALICAGAAPARPKKRWTAEGYAAVCNYFITQNITPVLIGAAAEEEINSKIARRAPGTRDLTNQTNLFDIAALARRATGAVGNDTGPMHLIAAAGCPALSLFSSDSNPAHSRPIGERTAFLQHDNLAELTADEVIKAILLR
jgi:ADP-heptose:LPS heptosyltransferase